MQLTIPQKAAHEYFLKSLAPLFDQDPIDWQQVKKEINIIFNHFFHTTDFSQFFQNEDIHIFVKAIDADSGNLVGIIQFLINQNFEKGSIKACYFGIADYATNRKIEQLLMSSIFKIFPETQRIFLHTRATNERLINLYKSWGFTQFFGA